MLVLTRKMREQLMIGDKVVVTILSVRNGQVRIGIEAPQSVTIRRTELDPVPHPAGGDLELGAGQPDP